MTELIRKQVKEILDEDRRINERVYQREKEQVKVFNESVAPKKERDIDTEVSIERDVEKFNSFLEQKINNIETILKRRMPVGPIAPTSTASATPEAEMVPIPSEPLEAEDDGGVEESKGAEVPAPAPSKSKGKKPTGRGRPLKGGAGKGATATLTLGLSEYTKQLDDILRTGDGLILWNNMARLANRSDISNITRSQIITKITESQNLVDAVVYGYKSLINGFIGSGFQNPYLSRALPKLISAYALYATIQRQLYTNSIKPIATGDIEVSVRDIMADFSPIVKNKMDELLLEADPTRNLLMDSSKKEALVKRIKILESEKGKPLSKEELARASKVFFGVVPEVSYIDPSLQSALDEQARREATVKADIERRPKEIVPLEIAPPVYYQTNPELISRVSEDIRKVGYDTIDTYNKALLSSPLLDAKVIADPPNLDDIVDNFVEQYIDFSQQYRNVEGLPPMSDADISDDFEASFPNVFNRERNVGANNLERARNRIKFRNEFRSAINELIKMHKSIVIAETSQKEEQAMQNLAKPQVSGRGRARFGRLGLGFDDRKNEMYDY